MYKELEDALIAFQTDPNRVENTGIVDTVTINHDEYQVVLVNHKQNYKQPGLGISSPIGCYLKFHGGEYPDMGRSAQADGKYVASIFKTNQGPEVLKKYSIMGFLSSSSGGDKIDQQIITVPHMIQLLHQQKGGNYHDAPLPVQNAEQGQDQATVNEKLKNGMWFNVKNGTEVYINDESYPENRDDAAILALGNHLPRVIRKSPNTEGWYETNEPPKLPQDDRYMDQYVRALRSYLKKLSIHLIERDDWILLWRGYLYTNHGDINFADVFKYSDYAKTLGYRDESNIVLMDASSSQRTGMVKWGQLQRMTNIRNNPRVQSTGGTANTGPAAQEENIVKRTFKDIGRDIEQAVSKFPGLIKQNYSESTYFQLISAINESSLLNESLTYNQMLTATSSYWKTRLRTVQDVHTQPPGLVMLKDGTVQLTFDFVSKPSTEGKAHQGYVRFIPERGKYNIIGNLKKFLGGIGDKIKKFLGKKVPPKILKGSDLRKMLCEVTCDCKDFKYRLSYADVKQGVTTQSGRTDNGNAPNITNPHQHPGLCKHLLATVRYLTDDAELSISKDFTPEQQEVMKKDRDTFYDEALQTYKNMRAPEADEIPEPEEPTTAQPAKPATPAKSATSTSPEAPQAPSSAPILPSYGSTQT